MVRFAVRRILHGILVVVGVTIVVFVITRMVGDPVDVILPPEASASERELLREQLGLDAPLGQQFVTFVGDLATLDLGESIAQRRPAADIIAERLPTTLQLVGAGMVLALVLAIPLGTIAALRPGTWIDKLSVTVSLLGLSIPQFFLGLLLILLFAVQLHWLPTSGNGSFSQLILPATTLALPAAGRLAVMVRSSMIDELNRPWVRTAKAKGMPFRRTVGMHAARNAAIGVVTLAGWELCAMLAGSAVIVEQVFAWPGIGFTALNGILRRDLVLTQAIVFVVAVLVVAVNIVIDLLYKAIDPRVRLN